MDILRFITAGSVDDGKSTVIGRLLHDTNAIATDQLESIQKQSKNKQASGIDLAYLTDGLRAEREQGITIDVAYKYFATEKRKFIIADAPGHVQYTRNLVTGASTSDLAVLLVDARNGISEQTRRHALITSILGIKHVVVAINKMDLVGYAESVFEEIKNDFSVNCLRLSFSSVTYVPICALAGDNVVSGAENMPWYTGKSLLLELETAEIKTETKSCFSFFPVQFVIRPQTKELPDYRGYAGKIIAGNFRTGDSIKVFPSELQSTISKIEIGQKEVMQAGENQSVVLHLSEDLDVSRGDVLVKTECLPDRKQEFEALICWMDTKPLQASKKYLLQHNSTLTRAVVKEIAYRINVNTFEQEGDVLELKLNEVGAVRIKTAVPVVYTSYQELRANGAAILVDETSNLTVAALMFL